MLKTIKTKPQHDRLQDGGQELTVLLCAAPVCTSLKLSSKALAPDLLTGGWFGGHQFTTAPDGQLPKQSSFCFPTSPLLLSTNSGAMSNQT